MAALDIDIGNTRLKWRLPSHAGVVLRLGLTDEQVVDELISQLSGLSFACVRVASVAAPELSSLLASRFKTGFGIDPGFAVVSSEAAGVTCGYEDVSRLGVDRWLAVLAARARGYDNALIVDCGSAVTVDCLEGGEHRGGYIVPGLRLMVEALYRDTSRVKVTCAEIDSLLPGRNTEEAVNRGAMQMVLGLIEKLFLEMIGRNEAGDSPVVLLTGGDASDVARDLSAVEGVGGQVVLVLDLVMEGLACSKLISLAK
ncbi:MAG: pantothenate kinase [Candidatus Pelagadaptatus aseana]|uniref:type III pantothenate kinase n=1 Tax=Candidatus Pelagadaptatus aseana TaxID=3120508 RepID=UPI0039B1B20C